MLLWTGGKWIEGLPDSLKSLSEPAFIGVSPLGWLVLALLLAGGWLLSRTAFGRDFYAAGDNLAAARQLGVAVNRTRMLAFTLNGMLAACAGIVFAAQIGFVPNQTGSGLGDESHRRLRAGRDLAARRYRHAAWRVSRRLFPHPNRHRTGAVPPSRPGGTTLSPAPVLLGVLVLDGRLRQALARHQRALKYSRFQPGNKGGNRLPAFPNAKAKRWLK